jgi:hypothetical protein
VELYLYSPSTPSWRGAQLNYRKNFTFLYVSLSIPDVCISFSSFRKKMKENRKELLITGTDAR